MQLSWNIIQTLQKIHIKNFGVQYSKKSTQQQFTTQPPS